MANPSSPARSWGGSLSPSCRKSFIVLPPHQSACKLLVCLRINLLQEFTHGCVYLNVMPSITFADRARDGHVHWPGVHLHRRSVRRGDFDEWNTHSRTVDQLRTGSVNDPSRRGFSNHFA